MKINNFDTGALGELCKTPYSLDKARESKSSQEILKLLRFKSMKEGKYFGKCKDQKIEQVKRVCDVIAVKSKLGDEDFTK